MQQVKRLRLCVTDNENMRAAFSLLRVMAANEVWCLVAIGTQDLVCTTKSFE
jgi:hypothetical protein